MDRVRPPADPLSLLTAAPDGEYALLELGLEWPELTGAQARVAAALRLFVLTRDPLDWLTGRGQAWATVNGDGDVFELCVYVLAGEVERRLAEGGGEVAGAVGPLVQAAVLAGARCEPILASGAYPGLRRDGQAPDLLEPPGDAGGLPAPAVEVRSDGWEPVGLGAVQDLVQDAFGPVDLDRSKVRLDAVDQPVAGCPACAGERFGFPGDLTDAARRMCSAHRAGASAITARRIARARASNPVGWRALGKGSARTTGQPEPAGDPVPQRRGALVGRNDPCPCGSGRKHKRCCGA